MGDWKRHATDPLSRDEENELVRRYRETGDEAAEDRLVRAHLRLVLKMAAERTSPTRPEFPDIVQEGCVGLLEGIRRFDPGRNVRVATYAAWWIRAFILRHEMDNARLIRAARGRDGRRAFFRGELGPREVSIDRAPRGCDEGERLADALADPDATPVDELADRRGRSRIVERELARLWPSLDVREQTLVRERIAATDPVPLRILARRFSVSGERLRQLEAGVLARLRSGIDGAERTRAA